MPISFVRRPGLVAICVGLAATSAPAAYDLSTPEKAMALCNKAFFDGDAAALKAAGSFAPGSDELFKTFVRRGQVLAATRDAVSAKFGLVAIMDYDRLLDHPLPLPTKMILTGDNATLIVASDEGKSDALPVETFRKTGGQWQEMVVAYGTTKASLEKRRVGMHVETQIIDGFCKQVVKSDFKKRDEAAAALNSRLDTLSKATGGDPGEAVHVARWFSYGMDVEKDPVVAFGLLLDAAERGNAQAMTDAGGMLQDGEGTRKDPVAAFGWFKRAADLMNGEGLRHLALCYQSGTGTVKDPAKALPMLLEAVKTDDWTNNYLGDTYRDGLGVKPDDGTALKYYEKAAKKLKSGYAMCEAGRCYERGRGLTKDPKKAVVWYGRSAKEGNSDGMFELARHMEAGDGTARNPVGARTWYEKAAAAGNGPASDWLKSRPLGR